MRYRLDQRRFARRLNASSEMYDVWCYEFTTEMLGVMKVYVGEMLNAEDAVDYLTSEIMGERGKSLEEAISYWSDSAISKFYSNIDWKDPIEVQEYLENQGLRSSYHVEIHNPRGEVNKLGKIGSRDPIILNKESFVEVWEGEGNSPDNDNLIFFKSHKLYYGDLEFTNLDQLMDSILSSEGIVLADGDYRDYAINYNEESVINDDIDKFNEWTEITFNLSCNFHPITGKRNMFAVKPGSYENSNYRYLFRFTLYLKDTYEKAREDYIDLGYNEDMFDSTDAYYERHPVDDDFER